MLAFVDELGKLSGLSGLPAVTDSADMAWIAYTSPEEKAWESRMNLPLKLSPERFIRALFVDPSEIDDPSKLLMEIHTIASDMQDVELNVSLYDIFTPEEFQAVYEKNNIGMTLVHGDMIQN
jgi:hypothetical protein